MGQAANPSTQRLIWRIAGESVQTLGKQKQKRIYSSIKLKYLL